MTYIPTEPCPPPILKAAHERWIKNKRKEMARKYGDPIEYKIDEILEILEDGLKFDPLKK